MRDLNAEAARVHAANQKWWVSLETGEPIERNVEELLMLVVSELAEAMEGDRKNLMDDKLPHRPMREVELADGLIRLLDIAGSPLIRPMLDLNEGHRSIFRWTPNFASNLLRVVRIVCEESINPGSQVALRVAVGYGIFAIIELAAYHKMDLWGAYEEKMAYNRDRIDHTREGRLAEGGKRY